MGNRMNLKNEKRRWKLIIICLAFLVLAFELCFLANCFQDNISHAKKECGKYQIIVYDIDKNIANAIIKDPKIKNAVKFFQTYTQSDKGICNLIFTNSAYFDLSKNKIITGTFPTNENEVMVDEFCACKFGRKFSDSIQKRIRINDKVYTITGVVTKEDEVISERTQSFFFCIKESLKNDTCSVILDSSFHSIHLVQKYIEARYGTKNILINSSFLDSAGFNSFGLPKSTDGIVCLLILLGALFSITVILLGMNTNIKALNALKIISVAVVSLLICLTSHEIKNIKNYNSDYSPYDYKLTVVDNEYGYKEDIESYLKNETMKYGMRLLDVQYEYVNLSLYKDSLSKKYIKHLKKLSTQNALQFFPYSTKVNTPVIIIYANQNALQEIIQGYDGTLIRGNECIAIQSIFSKHQEGFEFLVQSGETLLLKSVKNNGSLISEKLEIKKVFNKITLLSDDLNLPVVFVSKEFYNLYVDSPHNRIVYINKSEAASESLKKELLGLCGFDLVDLGEANKHYRKMERDLFYQILGLIIVIALLFITRQLNAKQVLDFNKQKRNPFLNNIVAVIVYFFCCFITSYLLYKVSIKTMTYYEYILPISDTALSIIPFVLYLNNRTITKYCKR